MATMIGKVTRERYEQLVADGLEQLAVQGRTQMMLGDHALEIEPMNPRGGWHAGPGGGAVRCPAVAGPVRRGPGHAADHPAG
ncbi:hypothetical protein [Nonomuraea insulae]|uniref:Uncharacterized protein n=1 Tax=Nonomuraea insulae TaxID=1616787 RepID=A0ABW1CRT3_9ACTN